MMSLDLGFFALPEAGFEANMAKSKKRVTPEEWWSTSIIEMEPGVIRYCGYAIEDLIGGVGLVNMIWLLTRGDLPQPAQAKLLEAALVRSYQQRHGIRDQCPGRYSRRRRRTVRAVLQCHRQPFEW